MWVDDIPSMYCIMLWSCIRATKAGNRTHETRKIQSHAPLTTYYVLTKTLFGGRSQRKYTKGVTYWIVKTVYWIMTNLDLIKHSYLYHLVIFRQPWLNRVSQWSYRQTKSSFFITLIPEKDNRLYKPSIWGL